MGIITSVNKTIFVFLFILGISISSYAITSVVDRNPVEQILKEKTVTIDLKSQTIVNILSEIQKQSGINYGFAKGVEPKIMGTFNLTADNLNVEQALNQLFATTKYTYRVVDNMISIIEKTPAKVATTSSQQQVAVTISGKIVDESNNTPIVGATIIVTGTTTGAITDEKGQFSIKAAIGQVLEISYTGMLELKYTITKAETNLILKMVADAMAVEDVVVTGFFTKRKSGFAGASTVITKDELKKVSTGNIFTTISALDAGFKINENNLNGSNPNKLPDFTIRGKGSFQNGSTSPIFILDGFEVSSQKVFDMDVNRIETITLLKDASATILYGSRASNGVIVIETVAPKSGQLRVTYDFKPTIGIVDLTGYDLMNAKEKLEYERLAGLYETDPYQSKNELEQKYYSRLSNVLRGVDTDWLSQPVRNAFTHAHSLFVEGGVDNVRYSVDLGYNNNEGVMKGSNRDRLNVGFALVYRIKDKVTIKNYASYANVIANDSPYGNFETYGSINPYEQPRDAKGKLRPMLSDNSANPLYNAELPNRSGSKSHEFTEQLSVDWKILESLRLRGQFSIVKSTNKNDYYRSSYASEYVIDRYKDSATGNLTYLPMNKRGKLTKSDGEGLNASGNVTLNYDKVFDRHIVSVGVGSEITTSNSNSYGFTVTGFPDDRYSTPNFAVQFLENSRATSNEEQSRAIGFLANANYIYDNRFFADLSFRYDGSSKFGSNHRFAPFWSVGAGWNIHNEKFLKNNSIIDMLKVRFSYGVTGNQEFSAYQARTMYEFKTDRFYDGLSSITLMGYGNPNLKWQNQYQQNYGFDLGFVENRYRASFNYYRKKTDGMLTTITVAPSIGLPDGGYVANLGEIQNIGYELNLNAVIIRKTEHELEWSVNFQGANNRNTLLKISSELKNVNNKNNLNKVIPQFVYEEGKSMSALKAVRSLGIDPATGREGFIDKNGNVTYDWNAEDKVYCGDTEPTFFGNVGTNLYFKGWNLNVSFRYRTGADYYNQTLASRVEGANPAYNADRRVLNDRWKSEGQEALYKDIKEYKTTFISDRFIQKEQLFEATNLSISYEFSKEALKKLKISSLRLSFYANDLIRFSNIKQERGLNYPFQRSFVFGLNVSF